MQRPPVHECKNRVERIGWNNNLSSFISEFAKRTGNWPRARQIDVIVALGVSIVVMAPVVLGAVIPRFPVHWLPGLAWPWYVPLGTAVTVAVGMISSLVSGRWADGRMGGAT